MTGFNDGFQRIRQYFLITNLVLTRIIYSESCNCAHAHNCEILSLTRDRNETCNEVDLNRGNTDLLRDSNSWSLRYSTALLYQLTYEDPQVAIATAMITSSFHLYSRSSNQVHFTSHTENLKPDRLSTGRSRNF